MVRTEASQASSPGSNPGGRIPLFLSGFPRELDDDIHHHHDDSHEETYSNEQPNENKDDAQNEKDPHVVPLTFLVSYYRRRRGFDRVLRAHWVAAFGAES